MGEIVNEVIIEIVELGAVDPCADEFYAHFILKVASATTISNSRKKQCRRI